MQGISELLASRRRFAHFIPVPIPKSNPLIQAIAHKISILITLLGGFQGLYCLAAKDSALLQRF